MCFMFLTSTASFPHQYGLGPKVNVKCRQEVKLPLGSFEYVEDASGLEGFQLEYRECLLILASPLSCVADPSRACTAKATQRLKRVDGIFGIYSSPLEPGSYVAINLPHLLMFEVIVYVICGSWSLPHLRYRHTHTLYMQ